jgi:hypothetical protein
VSRLYFRRPAFLACPLVPKYCGADVGQTVRFAFEKTISLRPDFAPAYTAIAYMQLLGNDNEAARRIGFTPAMRDGKPVSVIGSLEFAFNLY